MELDLNPVSRITTGAIGPPGSRVFYLQGRQDTQLVTLILEKQQVQSLALGVEQFVEELHNRMPELPPATDEYVEAQMELEEPIEPRFRVGQIGLGYDEPTDRLVLVARELSEEQGEVVRFWCTRSQLLALCNWGLEVASRGRPICGNCGEPIDPEGHFCPKRNGHRH